VPSRDASALADAVAGVLDDGALAARLAAGALRRAEALPTEADAVDQVAACYRRLASRRPHRGPGGGPSRGSRPKAM
jgi:hypothetical protein